jgi:alpha-D-ribose 1-methylphosphonate 5-phosphate C-P lyase
VIDTGPTAVGYGSSFTVGTSQAATIADVALVRANSSTHGVNFDQRHVPLTFSAGTGGLTVSAPASGAVAPPGWYMLFLIDDAGVPSVAKWVRIS